jgi:hypothetical protein
MADARALFTQQFDAARTALSQGSEPAAAESLRSAVLVARSDPTLQRELASALLHLGKLSQKLGRAGEAEQLLTEALSVSEGLFGMEHAALAPMLNELSRLYLQQSQFARAEEALGRLLWISQAKGEEHADVAAALAGLALVKRKLGDDASAEPLYRDALRIREKVLAPDSMVTVVTLEQLSETCEARGNSTEALALLQRALPTRVAALGASHATVHAAQRRVTALELQIAVAADAAAVVAAKAAKPAMPTPAWIKAVPDSPAPAPPIAAAPPTDPNELVFIYKPESRARRPVPPPPRPIGPPPRPIGPPPRPASPPPRAKTPPLRELPKSPRVSTGETAASLMPSPTTTPMELIPLGEMIMSPGSAHTSARVIGRTSGAVHRDVVHADVAHRDVASGDAAFGDHRSTIAPVHADSPEPARKKRTVLYASAAGVAAVAIAVAGLMLRPGTGGGRDPISTEVSAAQRTAAAVTPVMTAAATTTGSTAIGAAAMAGAARADSLRSAGATPTPKAPVVLAERGAPESAASPSEPSVPLLPFHPRTVKLPTIATMNVDSIVRSSTKQGRESYTDQIGTGGGVSRSANVDDGLASAPTIIGRAPLPRFPDGLHLIRPRGEVVVQVKVGEDGLVDVASMSVMKPDHALFTDAVRNVLPRFRFVPARSAAPASKAVAAWVTLRFVFAEQE